MGSQQACFASDSTGGWCRFVWFQHRGDFLVNSTNDSRFKVEKKTESTPVPLFVLLKASLKLT
jgi:hypothetical protein